MQSLALHQTTQWKEGPEVDKRGGGERQEKTTLRGFVGATTRVDVASTNQIAAATSSLLTGFDSNVDWS